MKKNKKGLKKLSLNKNVISKLKEGQLSGGTNNSLGCPVTYFCPTEFCLTDRDCPTLRINCIKTLNPNDCIISIGCSFPVCNSAFTC